MKAASLLVAALIVTIILRGYTRPNIPTEATTTTATTTTTTSTTTITTTTTTAPELYDIPLPDELQLYTINVCKQYGVDPELVFALMGVESEYRPDVISCTNDYGLMQINRCNHKWLSDKLGVTDFLDARQNIKAGVHILSGIAEDYDTPQEILMVYNCGEYGARTRWKKGIYTTAHTEKVLRRMESLKRRYAD